MRGVINCIRGKKSWGKMKRKGLEVAKGADVREDEASSFDQAGVELHADYWLSMRTNLPFRRQLL
jgi:hypothetical protein